MQGFILDFIYQFPKTELLKWAKFFHAEKKEEFEMMAKDDEYLERAYNRLMELSADEQKRLEYEARKKHCEIITLR